MKPNPLFNPPQLFVRTLLALTFAFAVPVCASAQTRQAEPAEVTAPQVSNAQVVPVESTSTAAETDAAQKRLTRARSLAAIGKLAAAAGELESLRASTKDESVRDVTRVLLMAIFVEMPDYAHAGALLDEAFKARTAGQTDDETTHSYFALAGQTVNAVRTHLERYRSFGVNVADTADLPVEAAGDIEQLRGLLEHVVEQAKSLHEEQIKGGNEGTRGLDAAALLEDAATVRMRLSRHDQDRALWQSVVSDARRHLFSSEMRIASISEIPSPRPAPIQPAPSVKQSAPDKSAAAPRTEQMSSETGRKSSKKSRPQANEQAKQPAAATTNTQPAAPAQEPGAAQPQGPLAAGAGGKTTGGGPLAVGSLAGKAKQRVSPTYPSLARTAHIGGVVTVFLLVNEKGEVESVQRADGPPQLQQAASDAARHWKFNPTLIDGQPVRVIGYLSFNFSL
ncbi:MAG: periplasmic protein TonB [Acidobacteriota bacterium]|nr:periplasmic protein TonB [Acidobacteriota bacterium]